MITPSYALTATERVLPRLALDFTTASLDSRITFTRATGVSNPATFVNSSGVITAATNNQPRFDYNPTTLVCKGLLIEESRANLATYSNDFSNAAWTKIGASIPAEAVLAPDGSTNAWALTEDNTTGRHMVSRTASIAVGSNAQTASVFWKRGDRRYAQVAVIQSATDSFSALFDLDAGIVTDTRSQNGVATQTVTGATITGYGGGWYRLTVSGTTNASASFVNISASPGGVFSGLTLAFQMVSYAGTTGYKNLVFGAQLEAGAFATSYIPTTTTALTRNADVAEMTGTNFSDWFNASEGTFKASAISSITSGYAGYLTAYGAANIFMAMGRTPTYSWSQVKNTTTQANFDNSARTSQIACLTYKANSFAYAAGGTAVLTDNAGTIPTVSELRIGKNDTTGYFNGWISLIEYWPQRLIDAEVQAFSK